MQIMQIGSFTMHNTKMYEGGPNSTKKNLPRICQGYLTLSYNQYLHSPRGTK